MDDFTTKNTFTIGNMSNDNYFHIDEHVLPSEIEVNDMMAKKKLLPTIWENGNLNPKIRLKLLDIADLFWEELNLKWVKRLDIILTGSICNYNWNEYSDIDLHIIINYADVDENIDLVRELLDVKRMQWNENHINLKIYKHQVELYVQDANAPHISNGVFSLERNQWVKKPNSMSNQSIKINKNYIKSNVAFYINYIDNLSNQFFAENNDEFKLRQLYKKVNSLISKLHLMRKQGLSEQGEMSPKNIIYKILRLKDYIKKIYELKFIIFDYLNSIK